MKKNRWICLLLACLLLAASEKTVLRYASFNPRGVDPDMAKAVSALDRSRTDVEIRIENYWGKDRAEAARGRQRLLAEILSGNIPDIIDLGFTSGEIYMLPYRQLAAKGYLEDLWPYIENDPELGRESLFEAPLNAASVSGGLYMVFDSVRVETLVGARSVVGDRTSWTLEDLWDAFSTMPEGSTVLPPFRERSEIFIFLFTMTLDSYVDWEAGSCAFDCEEFRSALEFVKSFPEERPYQSVEVMNEEAGRQMREGKQMLEGNLRNIPDIQRLDAIFGETTSFVGYPTTEGSVGSAFHLPDCKLVMSSACKNKQAAWELIRQLLLPRYGDGVPSSRGRNDITNLPVPVNLADLDTLERAFQSSALAGKEVIQFGKLYKYRRATPEECQRFDTLLNSIDRVDICDMNVFDIVWDSCGAYFAGDKSLDDTIALIENRVGLYVNEVR